MTLVERIKEFVPWEEEKKVWATRVMLNSPAMVPMQNKGGPMPGTARTKKATYANAKATRESFHLRTERTGTASNETRKDANVPRLQLYQTIPSDDTWETKTNNENGINSYTPLRIQTVARNVQVILPRVTSRVTEVEIGTIWLILYHL